MLSNRLPGETEWKTRADDAVFLPGAFAVWLIIIGGETVHGTLRTLFLVPLTGDFHARQIGVFIGSLLILGIAWLFIGWVQATSTKALIAVGLFWTALTVLFEVLLGRLVLGVSWEKIASDYDITNGGLMLFGLTFMVFAPLLATQMRGLNHSQDN